MTKRLKTLWNKVPTLLIIMLVLLAISHSDKIIHREGRNDDSAVTNSDEPMRSLSENLDSLSVVLGSDVALTIPLNDAWTAATDDNNNTVGYLLNSTADSQSITGYAGPTPVSVVVDNELIIRGVTLLENSESYGFIRRITTEGLFDSWNGKLLSEAVSTNVEAISGATMSSDAIIATVHGAIDAALKNMPATIGVNADEVSMTTVATTPFWTIVKHCCSFIVIMLSLFCYFAPGRFGKRFRLPLLIASVLVLGVWEGAFVSLALLYGWLMNGVALSLKLAVVLTIVVLAVVLPLIFNRQFYCSYVCPFGAAQELLGKCSRRKLTISDRVVTWLLRIKKVYLPVLVVLIIALPHLELSNFEPFTVFMINSASVSAIVLACVSLLLSPFIGKPWCRFVCPTGYLLSRFIS